MYDEFFSKAHELTQAGVPFATATVVRAEAPTSGKPGDRAIITIDGVMHGWIGGSCAQPTVVKEALNVLAADESKLIRLSTDPEGLTPRAGLTDLLMTCFSGGTLEIHIEGHHPRPRLLIVGDLPVAQALAHLGKAMNYHVVAVDFDGNGAMGHAHQVLSSLDGIEGEIRPNTYTIIATHGNYDEHALSKIFAAQPSYVGLVSSRRRAEQVRDYLHKAGFSDNDLSALKAPAGLDIQARRGDEIALSIMAEIVQKRRNAELLDLSLFSEEASGVNVVTSVQQSSSTAIAIDPICKMEVKIATAAFKHEHAGEMYYFCCAGCETRFAQAPEVYLNPVQPTGMISLDNISVT